MHEIRFCHISEYKLLIEFIDKYWKKDHIFTKDKNLLDWQHLDKTHDRYNFVVAYNKITNEFDAILGFIPISQYDKSLVSNNELWLAIWKIKDSMSGKVSGIQLLFYLNNKLKPTTICSIGITEGVKEIYDAFKYKRDTLSHFYIVTDNYRSNISDITSTNDCTNTLGKYQIKEVFLIQDKFILEKILVSSQQYPIKSIEYIKNRFLHHPTYKYHIYGIFFNDDIVSFFIARKIQINNGACLRIVDYYGDFIDENICYSFKALLKNIDAEYIDMVCHVPQVSAVIKMGFLEKDNQDIVPEYFEPFVQKNVTIDFAYKSKNDIFIFKGDSDQDRPSQKVGK